MIYEAPRLDGRDHEVLQALAGVADELGYFLRQPRRWFGTLRRATFARAIQGSNSIEGYHASVEDVLAVMEHEQPFDADEETEHAIAGYRDAMTYVLQLAASGQRPQVDETLLKALHFMMLKHDLSRNPGQWRPGSIWVENQQGDLVYTAPDREDVEPLVAELIAYLADADDHPMVVAAMAHLNLTMIHPFSDGNGRMARCLQSLVLAGAGPMSPEFLSIEEYLGSHTREYYDVLGEAGQGRWQPRRSAHPWVRFCLGAHYRQAHTLLRRIRETEALWDRCEQLVAARGLPGRSVGALCDAARGLRLWRSLYVKVVRATAGEEITDTTATRDLRALAEGGLLEPRGEKRARQYHPTEPLAAEWRAIREARGPQRGGDPYAGDLQETLPGVG